MAYNVRGRKCPMLFFKGKIWQRKPLSQFCLPEQTHAKRSVLACIIFGIDLHEATATNTMPGPFVPSANPLVLRVGHFYKLSQKCY
jgi:hypothetical protein